MNGERNRRVDTGELVLELGDMRLDQAGHRRAGVSRRLSSATSMSITWRSRVRAMRPASMSGSAPAAWRGQTAQSITNASMQSVLASHPLAPAKWRTHLRLATAT